MSDIETGSMSIPDLNAAIIASEDKVKAERASQLLLHNAVEAKRKAVPIVATPNDQVLTPGHSDALLKWVAGLPADAKALLKKTLGGN
jgi:hypothetical protein